MMRKTLVFAWLFVVLLRPTMALSQAEVRVYRSDEPSETLDVATGLNLLLTDAVRINGKRVGYFLIDTGSNRTILAPGVVEALGLEMAGGFEINGEARGEVYTVDQFRLGPLVLDRHMVGSVSLDHMQVFAEPLVGILGCDVLGQVPVTLDYRAASLTFHDPERFKPPAGAWAGEMVAVNLFREGGKPATRSPAFCPAVSGEINGQAVLMLLDTGKNNGLVIAPGLARDQKEHLGSPPSELLAPINFETESLGVVRFTVDRLALLGTALQGVFGARAQLVATREDPGFDVVVGGSLLRDHRLTLDFGNRKVWSQPTQVDTRRLDRLAEQGKLDQPNLGGVAPLFDALRFDDEALVEALLKAGASRAVKDRAGNTALMAAVYGESGRGLRLMLADPDCPQVNERSNSGATALMLAAALDYLEHGRLLIEHGASVDKVALDSWGAMHHAANMGGLAFVRLLLEHGADADLSYQGGPTPILIAGARGALPIVELLAEKGADLQYVAKSGETLMHAAAYSGEAELLQWAFANLPAALIDRPMANGVTPMMMAADRGHAQAMAELIEAGAKPDARAVVTAGFGSESAIHMAAAKGHAEAITVLLKHGVSPDEPTGAGVTPLMMASALGESAAVKVLLDHAARVDRVDRYQMTALHYAAKYGRTQAVAMLIGAGSAVSAEGDKGMRPLDLAALRGDEDTARLLVKAGADPDALGSHGRSARQLARTNGHDRLAELLGVWAEGSR